jgi:hypothetical protein
VARECAAAGVRALLVISAGFGETGADGGARQRELVAVCRASGMRLIGPNCLGVLNTAPGVSLNATFAAPPAPLGNVGLSLAERRHRDRHHRGVTPTGCRAVLVCIGRQQGRSVEQRSARVLGAGPGHRCRAAVPGVVREPAQVRARRAAVCPRQADPGGQERPLGRRGAGDLVAHRRAAVGLGRDRRRPVCSGRRDPHRHAA